MLIGTASSGSTRWGRARTTRAPPPTAPSSPPTWGRAPEWKPRTTARTMSRIATRSSGFTARSSHRDGEAAPRAVGGEWSGVARSFQSADGDFDRWRQPTRIDDRPRARRDVGDLELREVLLGERDAGDLLWTAALPERHRIRVLALVDDDRVEDRARLDATGPGRADDDRRSVHPRVECLGGHGVDVHGLTRFGKHRLAAD